MKGFSKISVLYPECTLEPPGELYKLLMHGSHLRDSNLISMKTWKFKVPQMILHETQDRDSAIDLDIVGVKEFRSQQISRKSGVYKTP